MTTPEQYIAVAFPEQVVHPLPDFKGAQVVMVTEFGSECAETFFRVTKDNVTREDMSLPYLLENVK